MESKTARAIRLMDQGETKAALSIAKGFRLGLTKQQHTAMTRAYECFIRPEFYQQLGFEPSEVIAKGRTVFYQAVAGKPDPQEKESPHA